jgi:hypothetical protein
MVIRQAEIWWAALPEPAGRVSKHQLEDVLAGLDVVLGR